LEIVCEVYQQTTIFLTDGIDRLYLLKGRCAISSLNSAFAPFEAKPRVLQKLELKHYIVSFTPKEMMLNLP
jgi:hypothetical protein